MAVDLERRSVLRRGRPGPIRPPWAVAEEQFVTFCTACDRCRLACPVHILERDRFGYPWVDFAKGPCSFCGRCREQCPTGALTCEAGTPPWHLQVRISSSCLGRQGISCRSCGEQCPAGAISFRAMVGGCAEVVIDQQRCGGCGACLPGCPVRAIELVAGQVPCSG